MDSVLDAETSAALSAKGFTALSRGSTSELLRDPTPTAPEIRAQAAGDDEPLALPPRRAVTVTIPVPSWPAVLATLLLGVAAVVTLGWFV